MGQMISYITDIFDRSRIRSLRKTLCLPHIVAMLPALGSSDLASSILQWSHRYVVTNDSSLVFTLLILEHALQDVDREPIYIDTLRQIVHEHTLPLKSIDRCLDEMKKADLRDTDPLVGIPAL